MVSAAASHRLAVFASALWWGSVSAVCFWVVPLLFHWLATPSMAGTMASHLFSAQTWVALGCGMLLLLLGRPMPDGGSLAVLRQILPWVVSGMLLALLSEFAVAPRILARENLALWHSLGSGFFLLQWACAGIALWKLAAPQRN